MLSIYHTKGANWWWFRKSKGPVSDSGFLEGGLFLFIVFKEFNWQDNSKKSKYRGTCNSHNPSLKIASGVHEISNNTNSLAIDILNKKYYVACCDAHIIIIMTCAYYASKMMIWSAVVGTTRICTFPGCASCLRSSKIHGRSCKTLSWLSKTFHNHARSIEDHPRTS